MAKLACSSVKEALRAHFNSRVPEWLDSALLRPKGFCHQLQRKQDSGHKHAEEGKQSNHLIKGKWGIAKAVPGFFLCTEN